VYGVPFFADKLDQFSIRINALILFDGPRLGNGRPTTRNDEIAANEVSLSLLQANRFMHSPFPSANLFATFRKSKEVSLSKYGLS
jgi:hypothetical protein